VNSVSTIGLPCASHGVFWVVFGISLAKLARSCYKRRLGIGSACMLCLYLSACMYEPVEKVTDQRNNDASAGECLVQQASNPYQYAVSKTCAPVGLPMFPSCNSTVRVVIAALPKTGTGSMAAALGMMGLRVAYDLEH